jgi:hypothetical protein
MKRSKLTLTVIFMLAMTSFTAVADVINVPGDYHSIQEAIDGAQDFDTVLVEPGVYVENIVIDRKVLTLASRFLTSEDWNDVTSTVIDGNYKGSVVNFDSTGLDNQSAFIGFTLENGEAYNGGGVFCNNSNTLISHCYIRYNNGVSGGGVLTVEGMSEIDYCIIYENIANYGGGVLSVNATTTISNCTIYGNTAVEEGGGVFGFESDIDITSCILWANEPDQVGLAGTGDPSTLHIGNSDVQGGIDGVVTNDNGELTFDEDNINEDPMFIDPKTGDFTFDENSPCYGMGMGAYNPPIENELSVIEMMNELIDDIWELHENRHLARNHANFLYASVHRARWCYTHDRILGAVCYMLDFDLRVAALVWWRILSREQGEYFIQCSNDILRKIHEENCDSFEGLDMMTTDNLPYEFDLSQNYPNPFNATTRIDYSVPEASTVQISVFDMTGRRIATLVNGQQEAGQYNLTWNAQGNPAGMYLVRMEAGNFTSTKQMMYIK